MIRLYRLALTFCVCAAAGGGCRLSSWLSENGVIGVTL